MNTIDEENDKNLSLVKDSPAVPNLRPTRSGDDLRSDVREIMARERLQRSTVAKKIGYSRAPFTQWLDGKYKRNPNKIEECVSEWLAKQPKTNEGYLSLYTSEQFVDLLSVAQESGDMALGSGGPGIGKTFAIRHFVETSEYDVWVATMSPASSGLVSSLQTVAEALELGDSYSGARGLRVAICQCLKKGSWPLLIIDEAQHLSMAALEELRSIHDETGCGLAFIGNETAYAKITGGSRTVGYAQLFSRLKTRLHVSKPTLDDVDAICENWRVGDKQAINILRKMADRPGALRLVTNLIRLIIRDGNRVTVQNLKYAVNILGADL